MSLLAEERKAFRAREQARRRERMARKILRDLGWTTPPDQVEEEARKRYELDDREAFLVAQEAFHMQGIEEGQERHIDPNTITTIEEEHDVNQKEMAEKYREETRRLLQENPLLSPDEMYRKVINGVGGSLKVTSWRVTYYYPIRKELKENGGLAKPKGPPADSQGTDPSPEDLEDRKKVLGSDPEPDQEDLKAEQLDSHSSLTAALANGRNGKPIVMITLDKMAISAERDDRLWTATLILKDLAEEEFAEVLGADPVRSRLPGFRL